MKQETLTIVLAGGVGSRLEPLTNDRAKPAVPFGAKFRIIDFTLSNCLHSGLRRVLVLTQYMSLSLQKHLRDAWSIFNPELKEFITPVPPQMRAGNRWYQGTADAVFQNLYLLKRSGAKWVLILSGDHIYRMDYAALLEFHRQNNADITVATMAVPLNDARAFGVLATDPQGKITAFEEKPDNPDPMPGDPDHALASMGIYVFSVDLLIEALEEDAKNPGSSHDFGKDLIPKLIETSAVYAYLFGTSRGRVTPDRYWRDVGTIDSYFEANMDLLKPVPPLNLYQTDWPIRSHCAQNPPLRAIVGNAGNEGVFINSMAAGGVVISGGEVRDSILFANVYIDESAQVKNAILFEGTTVGSGAKLQNCIVDKNVHIPAGITIGFDPDQDASRYTISPKGVVVIPKGYTF